MTSLETASLMKEKSLEEDLGAGILEKSGNRIVSGSLERKKLMDKSVNDKVHLSQHDAHLSTLNQCCKIL